MFFSRKKNKVEIDLGWLNTDIHSHLIPDIDDGSPDMETSVELIRGMAELGYKKLITTPHILWEMYPNTPDKINRGLDLVRERIKKEGINIELAAAAEYFIDEHLEQQLKNREPLLTLNGSLV